MKPTLNEEIEMSSKAIDYVNSLEVKDEQVFTKKQMIDLGISNNIPEMIEKHKKNSDTQFVLFIWVCVALSIIFWALGIFYLIQKYKH